MKKLLVVAAAILLPLLAAVPSAQAAADQICGNTGTGYCLNAWNGGPAVNMYYGGYANDAFSIDPIFVCNGKDTVEAVSDHDPSNCPFTDVTFDQIYHNDTIAEIVYDNTGQCVVTNSSLNGTLGACGNINGSGAGNGAFNVLVSCGGGGYNMINRYWTNSYGTTGILAYVASGGNPGLPLIMNSRGATCWGGSGFG
jgi:hypothetical protein